MEKPAQETERNSRGRRKTSHRSAREVQFKKPGAISPVSCCRDPVKDMEGSAAFSMGRPLATPRREAVSSGRGTEETARESGASC